MYSPCKECTERKLYCHSSCEKYTKYAEEREKFLLARHKEYRESAAYTLMSGCKKTRDKRLNKKKSGERVY